MKRFYRSDMREHAFISANGPRRLERLMSLPVLLAAACAAVLVFHGTRGLYETTEGRYAECAREMVQAKSWMTPVLNGAPHWTKPPLTYWAIGIPCAWMGPTTWAARLYLIPCYLGTIAAVWWLAFRVWRDDRRAARLCAVVYATSAIPLAASQSVSTDYPLTLALTLVQACFWESFRKRSVLAGYGMWFCLGVAFLIKGPPSLLVLPALLAVWFRSTGLGHVRPRLFSPLGLAVFLLVGASWYLWEAWLHPGLFQYWVGDEVVGRALSDKFNRNPQFYQNFRIYLPVLVFGTLPWSGWLAFRWKRVWTKARGFLGKGRRLSVEALWLLLAFALPLAVFLVSRSKLPLYLLPLFVPLSVGAGRMLGAVYASWQPFERWVLRSVAAVFLVFVIGKGIVGAIPQSRDMAVLYAVLTEKAGIRDPACLSVYGEKPLNGLSYYYDHVLPMVGPEELMAWLEGDAARRSIVSSRSRLGAIKRSAGGRPLEIRRLFGKWRLVRLPAKATQAAVAAEGR